MSQGQRIEARGVRCLECKNLDLQKYPETAKNGFGTCSLREAPHFVSFRAARNCADFDPLPAKFVAELDKWADEVAPMFWRIK